LHRFFCVTVEKIELYKGGNCSLTFSTSIPIAYNGSKNFPQKKDNHSEGITYMQYDLSTYNLLTRATIKDVSENEGKTGTAKAKEGC
jgi:hypothetical protein